ncbi:hypothetical protein JCM10212_005119 [Sporobolomyces blumeae]
MANPTTTSDGVPASSVGSPTSSSSRDLALAAAQRRQAHVHSPRDAHSNDSSSTTTRFNPHRSDVVSFSRIIDSEIVPYCPTPDRLVETLSTLHTLLSNVVDPPNPAQSFKYRQVRLSNPKIHRTLVQPFPNDAIRSTKAYLVQSSFRISVLEFEPFLVFPSSPTPKQLYLLKVGLHVLDERVKRANEAKQRQERARDDERRIEDARKLNALKRFEEDREARQAKDERAKLARQARDQSNVSTSSPSTSRGGGGGGAGGGRGGATTRGGGVGRRRADPRSTTTTRSFSGRSHRLDGGGGGQDDVDDGHDRPERIEPNDVDDEEEQGEPEEEEADLPPSYGSLHGRVLGTGLPPEQVVGGGGFVTRQDLEDSD